MDIYAFLAQHSIAYERCDHPAVFTCEEAEKLVPNLPGGNTKNLFLRDKAGKRHVLAVVPHEKNVDLKTFAAAIGMKGVSFASPERLLNHLGVTPGATLVISHAGIETFLKATGHEAKVMDIPGRSDV